MFTEPTATPRGELGPVAVQIETERLRLAIREDQVGQIWLEQLDLPDPRFCALHGVAHVWRTSQQLLDRRWVVAGATRMLPAEVATVGLQVPQLGLASRQVVSRPGWAIVVPQESENCASFLIFGTEHGSVWDRPFRIGPDFERWVGTQSDPSDGTGYGPIGG